MNPLEIRKYLEIGLRRKYWIIIPFLLTLLGGLTYALTANKIYEAKTLILVQEQKVPQTYVKGIVTSDIEDRLRTITQQVTSRTNLETVIKEYGIFSETSTPMEQKVESIRKRILLDVIRGGRGGNAFSIAYRDTEPKRTMEVTNALASNFISENLKIRESQALGTSVFLTDELETVKRRLVEKEENLKKYRQQYMGAMPEHLTTNLTILTRLQSELEQLNDSLRDAENRKLIIQQQISQAKTMQKQMNDIGGAGSLVEIDSDPGSLDHESAELSQLREALRRLQIRYTENHPDVRRVKSMIAELEAEQKAQQTGEVTSGPGPGPQVPTVADFLTPQIEQVNLEIETLKGEIKKVQERVISYELKVEQTPKREQELVELNRDYENLRQLYDSLLSRKLEADIAVSMEKKQKGEQFRIIDPAKIPEIPVEPDMRLVILAVLIIGLGLGGGLAYLKEMTDTSFKNPEEMEKDLELPVLISMPIRYTREELKRQRIKGVLKAASVTAGFAFAAMAIILTTKGINPTIQYVKNTLANLGVM